MLITGEAPFVSQAAQAKLVWMGEQPLTANRQYDLKIASKKTQVSISEISHLINVNTLEKEQAEQVALNEVAAVKLNFAERIAFDL